VDERERWGGARSKRREGRKGDRRWDGCAGVFVRRARLNAFRWTMIIDTGVGLEA
jgi:hypothetical protein